MRISVGDTLPDATFLRMGEQGPEPLALEELTKGQKVVMFGLPGAFTRTCSAAHVPSFIRTAEALRESGIDRIICFSVNDPSVMRAWGEHSGGIDAGIEFIADADGAFTKALGLAFDAPPSGFYGRTIRHTMVVENGVVKKLYLEEERGVCNMTAGETVLAGL